MLRKCTDEDISDEECKNVIDPFYDNFDEYVVTYIMPEVIAFYIASSFYRNAMWEATFLQHFNSAADVFNLPDNNYEKIKNGETPASAGIGFSIPSEIEEDYEGEDE